MWCVRTSLLIVVASAIACEPKAAEAVPATSLAVTAVPESAQEAPDGGAGASHEGMVRIPGGAFTMGTDDSLPNEGPPRRATVAAFFLDVREVSVVDYAKCMQAHACGAATTTKVFCNLQHIATHSAHPMNCVTWDQAVAYCAWRGKRLPTEQEWERAARGDDARRFPWGADAPRSDVCWKRPSEGTCAVGESKADKSPYGILDMDGNVHEWTSTTYEGGGEILRVIRGGAWHVENDALMRATWRQGVPPSDPSSSLGFRCAS
jgi:formylglycine-generating enzyme required for sulfatase activity